MDPISPGVAFKVASESARLAHHLAKGDHSRRLAGEVASRLGPSFDPLNIRERRRLGKLFRTEEGWGALLDAAAGSPGDLERAIGWRLRPANASVHERSVEVSGLASTYFLACLNPVDQFAVRSYVEQLNTKRIQDRLTEVLEQVTPSAITTTTQGPTAALRQYTQLLKSSLSSETPATMFRIPLDGRTGGNPAGDVLAEMVVDAQRIALCAPAGAGKSSVLIRTATILSESGQLVIYLRLRGWTPPAAEGDDVPDSILEASQLLNASVVGLDMTTLDNLARSLCPEARVVWIADGLNEVSANHVDALLQLLDSCVGANLSTRAIVSDRSSARYGESEWRVHTLGVLAEAEVDRILGGQIEGKQLESLTASQRALLRLPFFLDIAVTQASVAIGTQSEAVHVLLRERVRLQEGEIEGLAVAVFGALEVDMGLSIDAHFLLRSVGERTVLSLLDSGLLIPSGYGRVVFYHQLVLDFLAAIHVGRHEELWSSKTFDVITLRANSYEAMIMAVEQLPTSQLVDKFLTLMYDWNWYVTVRCIADARLDSDRYLSPYITLVIAAMVAEKQYDPVEGSRLRAQATTALLDAATGMRLNRCATRRELAEAVMANRPLDAGEPVWFAQWLSLFARMAEADSDLTVAETQLIQSTNPVIGWTVANVFRQMRRPADSQEHLRAIYAVFRDQGSELAATTRWRVAHALGRVPSSDNVDLLTDIVDHDEYDWARYGAVRSLIELAIYSEPQIRAQILNSLQSRLGRLGDVPLRQLSWASRHEDASLDWPEDILPLIEAAAALAHTKKEHEAWAKRTADFHEWANRRRTP
jgi:hypothetical protein